MPGGISHGLWALRRTSERRVFLFAAGPGGRTAAFGTWTDRSAAVALADRRIAPQGPAGFGQIIHLDDRHRAPFCLRAGLKEL